MSEPKICPHYKQGLITQYGPEWKCRDWEIIILCDLERCGTYPCAQVAEKRMSAEDVALKLGFKREDGK